MNTLFRFTLAVSATSLLPVIYLVKSKTYLFHNSFYDLFVMMWLQELLVRLSLLWYLFIPMGLAGIVIFLISYLGKDGLQKGDVVEVKDASSNFLPGYLGYFFVSLSIGDGEVFTLCFVFFLVTIFVFLSQVNYYNLMFLCFGYRFYHIRTKNGLTLLLISRKKFKKADEIDIQKVYRVNDFTFIDKEK